MLFRSQLKEDRKFSPSALLERLSSGEAGVVTGIASEAEAPVLDIRTSVQEFRRARYERERAAVQRDIERLQRSGDSGSGDIDALLVRKGELGRLIQELVKAEE